MQQENRSGRASLDRDSLHTSSTLTSERFTQQKSAAFHKAALPTFTKQLRKNYTIITDIPVYSLRTFLLFSMQKYALFSFLQKKQSRITPIAIFFQQYWEILPQIPNIYHKQYSPREHCLRNIFGRQQTEKAACKKQKLSQQAMLKKVKNHSTAYHSPLLTIIAVNAA